MGWLWSACAGLEPASPHYAMRCATSCTIGTISRDCGLSVVTRGEFTQRFRLSQAYAYIIPRFLAPKLAKFQKKKRPLLAANCFPLFFFVIRLEDPLVSLYIADTVFCDRDDRLTIHVDVSIFRRRRKLDSTELRAVTLDDGWTLRMPERWLTIVNHLYAECPATESNAMRYYYSGHNAVETGAH